jgi:hypothetical protein
LTAVWALDPRPAQAWEVEVIGSGRVFRQSLPEDLLYAQLRLPSLTTTVSADRTALQAHGLVELRHRPWDALGIRLGLDTGLLELDLTDGQLLADGRPLQDRLPETLFLGETSLDWQLGETGVVELRIGKLRPRIGGGAILDAYAFGISADADLRLLPDEWPLEARAYALIPDTTFTSAGKNIPLFALQVGLHLLESLVIRAHSALYLDQGDGLAPILGDAYARGRLGAARAGLDRLVAQFPPRLQPAARAQGEATLREAGELYNAGVLGYDVATSGSLGYLGLEARYQTQSLTVEGLFLWSHGTVDANIAPNAAYRAYLAERFARIPRLEEQLLARQTDQGAVSLDGLFARLTTSLALPGALTARSFLLYLSGDQGLLSDDPTDRRYDAFVALAPLITPTSIFFNGGLAGSVASPTVVSPAPDGAGVWAVGLGLSQRPLESLEWSVVGAALWSAVPAANGGRYYGTELNLGAEFWVAAPWALTVDLGLFAAGDYFGDRPLGYQLIAGAQLYLGD